MKKLQNSLYLTRDELYAHKQREAIVIKEKEVADKNFLFMQSAISTVTVVRRFLRR